MTVANYQDVARLFPGLQDHAMAEILATGAKVDELEALFALLAGSDEGLIEIRQQESGRIDHLLTILRQSGIEPRDDRDR